MSKLKSIDFYCGSGISILFRKNENISPSFVESVADTEGKRTTIGMFYKFKTSVNNEAIIYIKCNSRKDEVKNLSECWKFSLTKTEKEKIQNQINKGIPFFVLFVCPNYNIKDNICGEAALLNIKDYEIISQRTDIWIGFWDDDKKKKSFYIRNNKGNGSSKDYYFTIKRNLVEKVSLDEMIEKYYPDYKKEDINNTVSKYTHPNRTDTIDNNKSNHTGIVQINPTYKTSDSFKVFVTDNPKICCHCDNTECTYKYVEYIKNKKQQKKINVAICPKCKRRYINKNSYKTFLRGKAESNIKFVNYDFIYLSDDNSMGCRKCNEVLSIAKLPVQIHYNIEQQIDFVEQEVEEDVFYCKKCKLLYANNAVKQNLLKKYGKNKILFQHYIN